MPLNATQPTTTLLFTKYWPLKFGNTGKIIIDNSHFIKKCLYNHFFDKFAIQCEQIFITMKTTTLLLAISFIALNLFGQEPAKTEEKGYQFTIVKNIEVSPVNNQQRAGTCWSYSGIGLVEAEMQRQGNEYVNLSEMFVVRKCYEQKAVKYVRMHGTCNFSGGGAVNDVFDVIDSYGIVPEDVYKGLNYGTNVHTHGELDLVLKNYLDGVIENKNRQLSTAWLNGFKGILDAYLGPEPQNFTYNGKNYTPRTFADEIVKIKTSDYLFFTSFTHNKLYSNFILELPDNWSNKSFFNVTIDDMVEMYEHAIDKGYTILWASDISEKGFSSTNGVAIIPQDDISEMDGDERLKWEQMTKKEREKQLYSFDNPVPEKNITTEMRQAAFDNYLTTDDHGLLITGTAVDQNGSKYFYVKNSWGTEYNNFNGYFYASYPFIKYKTVNWAIHKDGVPKSIKNKLGVK